MKHNELIKLSAKWLKKHDHNITIPNCSVIACDLKTQNGTGEIPDVIGWNSKYSVLLEVKVSRADFLKDKNKKFRKNPIIGLGQLRYYVCPTDLINVEDIPINWGLIYCSGKQMKIIHVANCQDANVEAERSILLSIVRRKA